MTTQHREIFNFLTLVWTHEDRHTSSTPTSACMNMFIPRFLLVTITLFWVNKSTLKSDPLVIKSSSWEELTALISQRFTEEFTWRDPTEETSGSGGESFRIVLSTWTRTKVKLSRGLWRWTISINYASSPNKQGFALSWQNCIIHLCPVVILRFSFWVEL